MKVIPIVIGALSTVTEVFNLGLEDFEIRGRMMIIQTKALLRFARMLRSVLDIWEDLLSLKFLREAIS